MLQIVVAVDDKPDDQRGKEDEQQILIMFIKIWSLWLVHVGKDLYDQATNGL